MSSLLEKSLNFNRNVKINFDGGNLTSDSGLLLYSEFDKQKSSYQKNAEKTTVAGYTAVKGIYNNNMIYTLKVDGLKENMQFKMTVIPVNENDKIEDLINDSEVSAIISSLKIEEK